MHSIIVNKRTLLFIVNVLFLALSGSSQSRVIMRHLVNEKAVPQTVVDNYEEQYPDVLSAKWYVTHLSYWQNDYSADGYDDWYNQEPTVVYTYEKPTYYEVDFLLNPNEKSRALYNLYGYWYETRTKIKALPAVVSDFLQASNYQSWKISLNLEKIESPMWPETIYRFYVSKGINSVIIRMTATGIIIQEKKFNE